MKKNTYNGRGGVCPPEHTHVTTRRGEPMCSPAHIHVTANKGRQTLPLRWMHTLGRHIGLPLLLALCTLYSCTSEDEAPSHAPITLTTPHIELGEVTASATSRAMVGAEGSAVNNGYFELYMLDVDGDQQGEMGAYNYSSTEGTWSAYKAPVVQNGAGQYYAGLTASVGFNATETMPAFDGAMYVYRGYITVTEDGTFTPGAALSPMTAAVQLKLKDANGAEITGEAAYLYLCSYDGLYMFADYSTGTDGKKFPMGKADPVISCIADNSLYPLDRLWGYYASGTYPATLTDVVNNCGKMESVTPTAPWTLFTIHYCPDGFDGDVPRSELFTWAVNYSGTLTLEAGKLYTFTVTLGNDRVITLDDDAVSISEWKTGETINIGK